MNADDPLLLLKFYITFSRFEYAMKRAGFFKQYRKGSKPQKPRKAKWPEPDWDTLSTELSGQFGKLNNPMLNLAREYIVANPPKTQIVQDGEFCWRNSPRLQGESDESFVLRMVRKVRANLFHQGQDDPSRSKYLLQATIAILEGCLKCRDDLSDYFHEE